MEASDPISQPLTLIVIEDSETDFDLLLRRLRSAGWKISAQRVEAADELRRVLAQAPCSAVISDHRLPSFGSLQALDIVRSFDPDLPFLIVSGTIGEEVVVEAMRAGADDYIMKDKLGRLIPALQRALESAATRRRQREAEAALIESEARFRALTANLPGMVFQMQLVEDKLSLAYVSEGSRRLFGLPPDRLIAEPTLLFDLLGPGDGAELSRVLEHSTITPGYVDWVRHIEPRTELAARWVEVAARARRLPSGAVLWDGVVNDITPQKRAEQELRHSRQELRELASHLTRIREQERESIAREIHDDVGSTLTAVKFDVAWLKGELKQNARLFAKLQQMDQFVDSVILSSTRIMHDLRPGIIDEGIVASLEWQARTFEQRMGVPVLFETSHEHIALDRDQAIAVFRICQEALNNVSKYAGASRVEVRLDASADRLDLEVYDDGCGISPDDMGKADCFGLRGMRERAFSLGGALRISGGVGRGTLIALWLPLSSALEKRHRVESNT